MSFKSNIKPYLLLTTLFAAIFSRSLLAVDVGPLNIGGAMRVNYIYGDYANDPVRYPQRGRDGGNFVLDTFRLNLDLDHEGLIGQLEYRWYDGYNFLHTGWLGYEDDEIGRLELGLTRVPFGVGPYGAANSFFFDMNYYVGLADKMRLGAKYTKQFGELTLDLAYFALPTFNGKGKSAESARYSYAIVPEDVYDLPGVYEESHQLNIRSVYHVESLNTEFGASAQWLHLHAKDSRAAGAESFAGSLHSASSLGAFGLKAQLTGYRHGTKYRNTAGDSSAYRDLIVMGAYDFAWPTATKGLIPSLAVSYTVPQVEGFFDSIVFYNDFSVLMKDGSGAQGSFNNSKMNVTGMAIAKDGWYIYIDYALSNGHFFLGDKRDDYGDGANISSASVGDFGANGNNRWKGRFNINFGYYF